MNNCMPAFVLPCLFFSFLIRTDLISYRDNTENLLTVVIMVKDEVDVIVPTLKPFVDAGIKSFLVFDTGSTDFTQQTVRDYFKQSGIEHGYIVEEPFIDFSTSRNRALDIAEEIFTHTTFFLMLDAEWYINNVDELLDFCKHHKNYIAPGLSGGVYLIRLLTTQDSINNYIPRMMRRGKNVRYEGAVHESIAHDPSGIVPDSVYFEYTPQQTGREKSKARCIRDYMLLKNDLEENPDNIRTLFYLGQTCQFLNDWKQAIFYYKKRFEVGDPSEEKYLAAYRVACAIEHLIEVEHDDEYTWHDALDYYLHAHNMIPYRAEPLFRIACYYIRHKQPAIAYLFAHRAAQLPYPHNNSLFIEKRIYEHSRYDILGQCAIYAGEYHEGKAALLKALEMAPENYGLYHNISIYNRYIDS